MYTAVATMDETSQACGDGPNCEKIKVKVPKRVLHFSDGVLEEYSDDDTDSAPSEKQETVVDPKTLTWGPWLSYKAWAAGSSTLAVFDYMGETLASFLGITTPKYHFEIEEYKRREAEKKAYEEEKKGWSEPSEASSQHIHLDDVTTNQPAGGHGDAV